MILVIGEILFDLIGEEQENSFPLNLSLGGAPLNVATNLSNLGMEVAFLGGLGDDILGKLALRKLNKYKNLTPKIELSKNRSTTLALFLKDENGDGKFEFIRKNPADCALNFQKLKSFVKNNFKIIHFGSLFLSDKNAREKMTKVVSLIPLNTIKSFDVNIREDIFKKDEDYKKYYLEFLSRMDLVKFSKEEILFLSNKDTLEEALNYFSFIKLVFVTLGKEGSICCYKNKIYQAKGESVKVVDSVGAGDSFLSGVLYKISSLDTYNLKETEIYEILNFANLCAKKTCLTKGAVDGYKSLEEVYS